MAEVFNQFINDNVLFYGTIFVLCVILLCLVCYIVWRRYRIELIADMKKREELEKLKREVEEKENTTKEPEIVSIEPFPEEEVVTFDEEPFLPEVEKAVFSDMEPEVEKVNVDLHTSDASEVEKTTDATMKIESLLEEMKVDLENQKQEAIDAFEYQQEEHSIISYKELKALAEARGLMIEDEEAPLVTTSELLNQTKEKEQKNAEVVEPSSVKEEVKSVLTRPKEPLYHGNANHRSQIISPVYGLMDEHGKYPAMIEKEESVVEAKPVPPVHPPKIDVKALEDENRHLDDFLTSLKEFRNNL